MSNPDSLIEVDLYDPDIWSDVSSKILEILYLFNIKIDFQRITMSFEFPAFCKKYIENLVEWDKFRNDVEWKIEKLLNVRYWVIFHEISLHWSKKWLNFYFNYDWKWMTLDSSQLSYYTHNIDNKDELMILYLCLNWYLEVLYSYLKYFIDLGIDLSQKQDITRFDGNTIIVSKIKIRKINSCVFTRECENFPFECDSCLRNIICFVNESDPNKLINISDKLKN